ncbi:unnamed protein product, partial [Litomosoides sigmodontis]
MHTNEEMKSFIAYRSDINELLQCYAGGVCNGLGYCPPMHVAHSVVCDCMPSYGCGQYGCYKLRARASKNLRLPAFASDQHWSSDSQLHIDGKSHQQQPPMLIPLNKFKFGKSIPLKVLDERRALAMTSPTAAELSLKQRTFQ